MNIELTPIGPSSRSNLRAPRLPTTKHRIRIFDMASGLLLGHTGDLSPGGMRLVGDRPIPTGQLLRVWVEFKGSQRERIRALLDVESVWSNTVDRGSYESGVRITDSSPEAARGIEALMSNLGGD